MKKYLFVSISLVAFALLICGCSVKKNVQTINYQSKLKQYLPNDTVKEKTNTSTNIIDLSDGRKVRYDARFGPNDVNFDFKVKNPY